MNMKRMRGRNHRGGGGGGGGGGMRHHNNGNIPLNRNHVFDSNGPDVRVRGTAQQLFEKYLQLGRDATSSGDRVTAEGYFQHAEHYFRIMNAMLQAQQQNQQNNGGHHNGNQSYNGQNGNGVGPSGYGQYTPSQQQDAQERSFDRQNERFDRSRDETSQGEGGNTAHAAPERQTLDLSVQQAETTVSAAAETQPDVPPADQHAHPSHQTEEQSAAVPRPRGRRPGRPRTRHIAPEGVGDQPELPAIPADAGEA
ncbi:putative cytosolic protein [Granulibacter bethesdensis]|uniref:Cytosolic protein n=1 Tax=Granulibacter bethesdensis TaxID=364410 RepID=A0AAC9P7W5_9PROT|nr:putative cytosolic protein [Granulibacter bethesdensis]APH61431.1 putative cytosolic protein [Granulibacter bethesdensis]